MRNDLAEKINTLYTGGRPYIKYGAEKETLLLLQTSYAINKNGASENRRPRGWLDQRRFVMSEMSERRTPEYTGKSCVHNRCVNHAPDWEFLEKIAFPVTGIRKFLLNIVNGRSCCGRRMSRYKVVGIYRCKECGRESVSQYGDSFLCECCGHRIGRYN